MARAESVEARLRQTLERIADGTERRAATERLVGLLGREIALPWIDELAYAAKDYLAGSDGAAEEALADLARVALADWASTSRWRRTVPADVRLIRSRWRTPDGLARAAAVAASLDEPSRLEALAFGRYEGRADLRGFTDPSEKDTARSVRSWDGIDFAGSTFRVMRFKGATITNCRFDGATFGRGGTYWPALHLRDTRVIDCTFIGADLNHAFVVGRKSRLRRAGSFQRVAFTLANLGRASFHSVLISDCDFSEARLSDTEFHADMTRCRFAGAVHGLMVYGHDSLGSSRPRRVRVSDLDFTEARLILSSFRFVDMSGVRLPVSDDLLIVDNWPCVHAALSHHAESMTWDDQGFSLRFTLAHEPRLTVGPQWRTTIDLPTLRRNDSPESVARFLSLLSDARSECQASSTG